MKFEPPRHCAGAACSRSQSGPAPRPPAGTPQRNRAEMIIGNARCLSAAELALVIEALEKMLKIRKRRR